MKKVKKMGMGGMPGTPVLDKGAPTLSGPLGSMPVKPGVLPMGTPMGGGPRMGRGPRGPMRGMPMGGIPGNPGFPASAGMPTGAAPLQTLSSILQGQPVKTTNVAPLQSSLAQGMPPAPAGGTIQTIARKKGGAVSASKRADGIAQRGKTKGRMV